MAGRPSPPGDVITDEDLLVAGVDPFDENVSKPHDIAYDRVQRRFLAEFIDPTIDKYTALAIYFDSLAKADKACIRAARKPENLAAEPGRQILTNAVDLFRVKSAWEQTLASECLRGSGPNYADRIKRMSRLKIFSTGRSAPFRTTCRASRRNEYQRPSRSIFTKSSRPVWRWRRMRSARSTP